MQPVTPRRNAFVSLTLALMLVFSGCSEDPATSDQMRKVQVETQVGIHQISFSVPQRWQHLDQGTTMALRNAGALLTLEDLGTFSRLEMIHQIKAAQTLYSNGEILAAAEHLKRLPYIQAAFLRAEDWLRVEDSWHILTERQERDSPHNVKEAYKQVVNGLYEQHDINLALVAEKLLQIDDRSDQREVSHKQAFSIDGRNAILIETWDRLSHSMKKQDLFVLNEGNILRLTVRLGPYESVAEPFDEIVSSLTFPAAL